MGSNGIWCRICAKYLAFGTYPTSDVDALIFTYFILDFTSSSSSSFYFLFLTILLTNEQLTKHAKKGN